VFTARYGLGLYDINYVHFEIKMGYNMDGPGFESRYAVKDTVQQVPRP
jgi:hypothetical protein